MTGQAYSQVLIQLARDYEFVIRDNRLSVQLKIKAMGAMLSRLNWQAYAKPGFEFTRSLNAIDCTKMVADREYV